MIEGEKWFSSNARYASFLITMVVTDPDARPHERMSMFIVPAQTPGVEIIRNVGTVNERDELNEGIYSYLRYNQVRVPLDAMLGGPGEGFKVAQSRLGGCRVHHAMRVVGKCQRAFDMMCERALSRRTHRKGLADGADRGAQGGGGQGDAAGLPAGPGLFPTEHVPTRRAAARMRYAAVLEEFGL